MANIYTLTEYINRALDKQYTSLFANVLKQIRTLSTARNAPIQRALLDLDNEAKRLVDENKRIDPENPALKNAITQHQNSLVATATLIQSNDDAIQNAAVRLAVAAVTSKVFTSLAGVMVEQGIDPVSERALGSYVSILAGRNIKWLAPTGVDFARGFVDSAAWISKMEGWGAGYAGLTRDVILDGISKGWSPLKVAQEMRKHAENIPTHAADNLMRTLQLTSYREASAAMELVNGAYLRGKVRIATLDERTCISCISLHGTPLKVGERVDDHYRGRCSEFYQTIGGPDFPDTMQADSKPGQRNFVPFQTGEEWFNSLSPERQAMQRSFMNNPAKLKAFNSGIPLSDFVGDHIDPVFGHQTVELSLIKAIGDDANKFYTRNGEIE
jgi:hypothetical protein